MKKVLMLSANPKNTSPLRLGEEAREIQAALKRANNREQFEIVTAWAIRVEDLRRALLDHQPTIVHFSGHGSGGNGLALENDSGQVQLVSTQSLARLFKWFQNQVECVLLNACYSEVQAEVIHQHIDYVVGMNQAIGDMAAIKFAIGFYDALFAGRPYEECFEIGCTSIDLENIPEVSTPQIKARKRTFSVQDNSKAHESSQFATQPHQNMTQKESSFSVSIGRDNTGQIIGSVSGDIIQNQYNNRGNTEKDMTPKKAIELIEKIELLVDNSDVNDQHKRQAQKHLDYAKDAVQEEPPDKELAGKSLKKAIQVMKAANETLEGGQVLWQNLEPIAKQLAPWLGIAAKNLL
jgi:hypothetical protein